MIDWDLLHRAPRSHDLADALLWYAPLRSDHHALAWHHFPHVPVRRHRVEVFLHAYGPVDGEPPMALGDVVDTVLDRMSATSELVRSLALAGHEPQRTWVTEGLLEPQRTWVTEGLLERRASETAWVEEHRHLSS